MAKLVRLDKFLCDMELGTRSEVKAFLKKGFVTVDGIIQKSPDSKIDPDTHEIAFQGKVLTYQEFYYYMLHKPAGVITATEDKVQKTVMSLLGEDARKDLFPVGRLDKDTEGLLLLTNDGELSHALLSPRKHVPKTYFVEVPQKLDLGQIEALEQGVDIGDDKKTLPAKVEIIDDTHIHLTISEGRYHQVKRMLKAVGSEVLYLKRISFGALTLDESLEKGSYRALTEEEITALRNR
ncbi:MAG: rRNA pseudouridine synthase [Lachnospiraceae bacterium]|nr:rRNA pseudouridine synthase [Lachnospiraceae bacterium]MBR3808195.1 rRNA pseudouridine synthase [Lachnospiraceae bacterium]